MPDQYDNAEPGSEHGPQPLDALMTTHELTSQDLVAECPSALTHKMIGKGRRGRRLSRKVQDRIVGALNQALKKKPAREGLSYRFNDVFRYDGG